MNPLPVQHGSVPLLNGMLLSLGLKQQSQLA